VFIFFSVDLPGVFFRGENHASICNSAVVEALIAAGLTIPLVMGDFDLSVGSMASVSGALAVILMAQDGWSVVPAIIAGLALCVVFGIVNGILVAVFNASAFIMTLAMASVITGVEYLLTKQETIVSGIPKGFADIGSASVGGVIAPVFVVVGIVLVAGLIMSHTIAGREVYAAVANREAARLVGVRITRLRMVAFVISALLAGLAGIFISAILSDTTPNAGSSYLLPAFAAAFLGSVLFPSRRFSVVGAAIAAWLLQMGATGLVEENFAAWTISVFDGGVLILAVLTALKTRRFAR
jgi:ribose transport system permease protein